jgi:polar amino acid transport system substrate-binding protein
MTDQRRRAGVFAAGAVSVALLANPLAALAQDDGAVVAVSEACQAANLGDVLRNPGSLTISTDNPAFFPWWAGEVPEGSEWADFGGYPPSGAGFEGAIAYAIAEAMGFTTDQVDWIAQPAFGLAFAPGEKDFDFHLGQVSFREERAEAVDFSDSYFDVQQAVVTMADNPITEITTLEELKDFQLGAPVGTTSLLVLEDFVQPNIAIKVYDDIAAGKVALENGQIDGLVVDTPTGFYIRDAELEDFDTPEPEGAVIGEIVTPTEEYFGIVLDKDSALTDCVNEAIAAIKASGEYDLIYTFWIRDANDAPQLQ